MSQLYQAASYLLLSHEDSDTLIVKLWPASAADHLQDGAAIILPVARHLSLLIHPAPCALQDDQVSWEVDALGQCGCCAKDLHTCHQSELLQAKNGVTQL